MGQVRKLLPPAIAICGLAGSGKSTVTRAVLDHFGGTSKLPFAYPLKTMVESLGVSRDDLWGDDAAKAKSPAILNGRTIRHTLQTLGTNWAREHMGADFWVNLWLDAAKQRGVHVGMPLEPPFGHVRPCVIADDCRFQNEADAVRSVGGIVVRVHRKGAGASGKNAKAHASEANDFPADFDIDNDGSIEDVLHKMYVIIEAYNLPKTRRPLNVDWGHSPSYLLVD